MQQFNMKQKERYKETELGLLPESWKVVKLEDIADVSSGGSAPQGKKYFEGNRPFIRVKHINNEDYIIKKYDLITEKAVKDYKLKLFSKGTIVFPKSGASIYLEKRAILPLNAYIVSHLCAVNPNKNIILQNFLFYFLINKKLAQKKADAYPTLNISEIKKVIISFPPLLEQKKIADILSTIQEAKEKTENVINSLKELKKSMTDHFFTYGPINLKEAGKIQTIFLPMAL
jgi:restriction endonuclease S subunit